MERIDADAEVRRIGSANDVPGRGEFVDRPAPRQTFVGDPDPQRQREHGELAQVAREDVRVGRGVRGSRRAREQDIRADRVTHLEHGFRDGELVLVQVPRQTLEVAQHLESRHAQAARAHRLHGLGDTFGMPDDVARRKHDLRKAGLPHGRQLGGQRAGQRNRVHAELGDVGQRTRRGDVALAVNGAHRAPART